MERIYATSSYVIPSPASPVELANLIRTASQEGVERTVYLAADARAKYREVEIVLKQIRLVGIASIVILANRSLHLILKSSADSDGRIILHLRRQEVPTWPKPNNSQSRLTINPVQSQESRKHLGMPREIFSLCSELPGARPGR